MPPVPPIVVLQYKADRELEPLAERLAAQLLEIVATVLNAGYDVARAEQSFRLKPSDIGVLVQQSGELDVNVKDIEIIIWAHARSERIMWRLYDSGNRAEEIVNDVRKFLSDYDRNVSCSVRVVLQPIAFAEF